MDRNWGEYYANILTKIIMYDYNPLKSILELRESDRNFKYFFHSENINKPNWEGNPIIHVAILSTNNEIISFFLRQGASLYSKNIYGSTPILFYLKNKKEGKINSTNISTFESTFFKTISKNKYIHDSQIYIDSTNKVSYFSPEPYNPTYNKVNIPYYYGSYEKNGIWPKISEYFLYNPHHEILQIYKEDYQEKNLLLDITIDFRIDYVNIMLYSPNTFDDDSLECGIIFCENDIEEEIMSKRTNNLVIMANISGKTPGFNHLNKTNDLYHKGVSEFIDGNRINPFRVLFDLCVESDPILESFIPDSYHDIVEIKSTTSPDISDRFIKALMKNYNNFLIGWAYQVPANMPLNNKPWTKKISFSSNIIYTIPLKTQGDVSTDSKQNDILILLLTIQYYSVLAKGVYLSKYDREKQTVLLTLLHSDPVRCIQSIDLAIALLCKRLGSGPIERSISIEVICEENTYHYDLIKDYYDGNKFDRQNIFAEILKKRVIDSRLYDANKYFNSDSSSNSDIILSSDSDIDISKNISRKNLVNVIDNYTPNKYELYGFDDLDNLDAGSDEAREDWW